MGTDTTWPKASILITLLNHSVASAPRQKKKKTVLSGKTFQGPTYHIWMPEGQKPKLSLCKINSSLHNNINEKLLETYCSFLISLTEYPCHFPLRFLRFSLSLDSLNASFLPHFWMHMLSFSGCPYKCNIFTLLCRAIHLSRTCPSTTRLSPADLPILVQKVHQNPLRRFHQQKNHTFLIHVHSFRRQILNKTTYQP